MLLTLILVAVMIFAVVKVLTGPEPPPPNERTRWYRVPTYQRQKRRKDRYMIVRVDEGEEPPFMGQLVGTGAEAKVVRQGVAHARTVIEMMKDKSPYEREQIADGLLWGSEWTREAEALIRAWKRTGKTSPRKRPGTGRRTRSQRRERGQ